MEAGKLRRRIAVERVTETNVSGDVTRTWSVLAKIWASVEPLSGKEIVEAEQVQARTPVRIRLRYYSGLTTADRLRDIGKGTIFNIASIVNEATQNRLMELICQEAA